VSVDPARLHRLLVRYWDHSLTDAEANELFAMLRTDPVARDSLQHFSLEAMACADGSAVTRPTVAPASWLSRRRLLGALGLLGLSAAGGLAWRWWPEPVDALRVVSLRGAVRLLVAGGRELTVGSIVPPGATVGTGGIGSAATFTYPDGTRIALASDSFLALVGPGRTLLLKTGAVSVEVPPGRDSLVLTTAQAALSRLAGATLTVGHVPLGMLTEFGVHQGRVVVTAPSGAELGEVRSGELLTIRSDGQCDRQRITAAPQEFAWSPARSGPPAWAVGQRVMTLDQPVLRAGIWDDPHSQTDVYQIRSEQRFVRGLFQLDPGAMVRVRYRVERPGLGQLALAVRNLDSRFPESGMLEWGGLLDPPEPPDQWRWLDIRPESMIGTEPTVRLGPPWVAFQLILSTFAEDLGLEVAEFRVKPPGG
jgi:ferric-dicitrate binding protein FerR (iron transport regulator)